MARRVNGTRAGGVRDLRARAPLTFIRKPSPRRREDQEVPWNVSVLSLRLCRGRGESLSGVDRRSARLSL